MSRSSAPSSKAGGCLRDMSRTCHGRVLHVREPSSTGGCISSAAAAADARFASAAYGDVLRHVLDTSWTRPMPRPRLGRLADERVGLDGLHRLVHPAGEVEAPPATEVVEQRTDAHDAVLDPPAAPRHISVVVDARARPLLHRRDGARPEHPEWRVVGCVLLEVERVPHLCLAHRKDKVRHRDAAGGWRHERRAVHKGVLKVREVGDERSNLLRREWAAGRRGGRVVGDGSHRVRPTQAKGVEACDTARERCRRGRNKNLRR